VPTYTALYLIEQFGFKPERLPFSLRVIGFFLLLHLWQGLISSEDKKRGEV